MAERSAFDSLVADLSARERNDLLERVRRGATLSREPLFQPEALPKAWEDKPAERLASLGLIARLVLFVRRLFTGLSVEELLVADELAAIAHRFGQKAPGYLDYRRGVLLERFLEQFIRLRDAARFFYDLLDRSVERDKGAFFAFLASIELEETHARLLAETDPAAWAEAHPGSGESEVRTGVLRAFDEILQSMPEDRRRAMYEDLRSVLFLKRLSGFLFERLLACFKAGSGAAGGRSASFSDIRDLLLELGDLLFSLAEPPSAELIEALFVFAAREELERPEYDAEPALVSGFAGAEEALAAIRGFNARIPMADLIRLVAEDPTCAPRALPGGEDWLAIFRAFWKARIEGRVDEWKAERRRREVEAQIATFLGEQGPPSYANISAAGAEGTPRVRLELAFRFLDGFSRGVFLQDINRPLKIVLVDGDFYRKENRVEFTDAYDGLLRLRELILTFDARLGPGGDLHQAWTQANVELAAAPLRRKRLQMVERGVDEEAERIVRHAADCLRGVVRVLRGLLKGEAGGRYDSLANLSSLDGRSNKDFLKYLGGAKDRCERALGLLAAVSGLDIAGAD